jgi:hypothetical protein
MLIEVRIPFSLIKEFKSQLITLISKEKHLILYEEMLELPTFRRMN